MQSWSIFTAMVGKQYISVKVNHYERGKMKRWKKKTRRKGNKMLMLANNCQADQQI